MYVFSIYVNKKLIVYRYFIVQHILYIAIETFSGNLFNLNSLMFFVDV